MTMADQDERLVDSLATSLFENLVVYTQKQEGRDSSSDEAIVCEFDKNDGAQIQKWLSEMLQHVQRLRRGGGSSSNNSSNDEDIVRKAMLQAIRRYKNKDPSSYPNDDDDDLSPNNNKKKKKQNVMSFSIFDQLNSGSLLDSMITWDRIEAAGGAESSSKEEIEIIPTSEQLKLLQKIEHLDDIMIEWENVNDLLFRGLLLLSAAAGKNGTTTTDTTNFSNGGEYLDLHNKWFEKSRKSTSDHQFIQIDLCQNIVSVLQQQEQKQLSQKEEELEDRTYRLCKSFRSMWMDWMLRGMFVDDDNERVNAIGITLWGWVTRPEVVVNNNNTAANKSSSLTSTSSSAPPPAFYPSQIGLAMMLIDPYARCIWAWFAHLKPDQVLQNLLLPVSTTAGSSPLPFLLSYCKDAMLDDDQLDNNNCSSSSSPKSDTTAICCRYALATIASILDVVRISRFPFNDIILHSSPGDDNNIASTREQVITVLFDLYIQLLFDTSSLTNADANNNNHNHNKEEDPIFASMAANAIETILWGCQRGSEDSIKVFQILKTKLEALELNINFPSVKVILNRFSA